MMLPKADETKIQQAYQAACERYAEYGVNVEEALKTLCGVSLSMHCWQGDDVGGFENPEEGLDGGLAVTGNYPGKARTADELRQDADLAMSLIPGKHRFNLHAIYAETGGRAVDRDQLGPEHFANWIDWAKDRGIGLDFNPTYFSHPKADDGFTLSHADNAIRQFWVDHGIACRHIGEAIGKALGTPCVTNVWIPDGYKDLPIDRLRPRARLRESLDAMFAEQLDPTCLKDAVECKLFGIGSESYVVGSHEFYLAYAIASGKMLCLDMGHFHPTEEVADKLSSIFLFTNEVLLHVSRGVRWDSDHVVILKDELRALMAELVRGEFLDRTCIALDFFDASINRVAAWVIGVRSSLKALLLGLLEPTDMLRKLELEGDLTSRLALLEELKTLPVGAVWEHYCLSQGVPPGAAWLNEVKAYEGDVLSKR